ncbi:TonB-dependent receptor domain-containing protein [Pseudomonas oryzihabitans]|uniref:TonB-dependent receptor domain-containing protein n=1 Tax=Pseudomonas oryzihabitans TaxID=47885 RepID=UPI003B026173
MIRAPNLYQLNPDYLISSRGNGCPIGRSVSCYLIGNEDLDAEVSVNKELGLQFQRDGWAVGITYFRNDYRNKIVASNTVFATTSSGADVLQWTNAERAVVEGLEGNLTIPLAARLTWTSNLTWMLQSEDKETGDPLSLIPRYTLNSMLDWQVTDKLSTQLNLTSYGRQKPPSRPALRLEAANGVNDDELGSYSLVGLNLGYQVNANLRLGAGVDNLFDKRLFREGNTSDAGAATYNEPGRTFYTSLSASF